MHIRKNRARWYMSEIVRGQSCRLFSAENMKQLKHYLKLQPLSFLLNSTHHYPGQHFGTSVTNYSLSSPLLYQRRYQGIDLNVSDSSPRAIHSQEIDQQGASLCPSSGLIYTHQFASYCTPVKWPIVQTEDKGDRN